MKITKTVNSCDCDSVNQELVDKVKKKFPEDEILGDLSDFFKVIGDGTRIRILWALDEIQGVYLDKEKAKKRADEINKRLVDYGGEAMLEEYEVIE